MPQSPERPGPGFRAPKPALELPLLARIVLFFTPRRRKVLGLAGLVATWLLLGLFPDAGPWHPAVLAREAAGAAVTVFAVVLVVAELRRPLALPQEQMLPRARERYAKEDSWVSPRHPEQVLDAVVDAFGPAVLAEDGSLDRAALAAVVFGDAGLRSLQPGHPAHRNV